MWGQPPGYCEPLLGTSTDRLPTCLTVFLLSKCSESLSVWPPFSLLLSMGDQIWIEQVHWRGITWHRVLRPPIYGLRLHAPDLFCSDCQRIRVD